VVAVVTATSRYLRCVMRGTFANAVARSFSEYQLSGQAKEGRRRVRYEGLSSKNRFCYM
jgi:hypothetical protein